MVGLSVMTSVCPNMTLDETIAAMKRTGYSALEPRVEWKHDQKIESDLSPEARRDLKARFDEEGLAFSCIATSIKMADPDPEAHEKAIRDTHTYIDLAADLGCPYIRTFGGTKVTSGQVRGQMRFTAESYRQCLSHARERGVVVLLETHDYFSNSSFTRDVVERVDDPNLQVLWDFMHPQRFCESIDQTFRNIGKYTRHIHAHDANFTEDETKTIPSDLGAGVFDHATPLQLLSVIGFEGYFSVEVIHAKDSEHDAEGVMQQYAEAFGRMQRST